MKCQRCEKPATFHITELVGGDPQQALHLCEDHAREYLTQADGGESETPSLAGALAQSLAMTQTAEDLARLDEQACPICGITFFEFRKKGRLGCPHDYTYFATELEPLVLNIHGEPSHTGKVPKRSTGDSSQQTEMIRLRREMKEAIEDENYEQASEIRDKIRALEGDVLPRASEGEEAPDDADKAAKETKPDDESA